VRQHPLPSSKNPPLTPPLWGKGRGKGCFLRILSPNLWGGKGNFPLPSCQESEGNLEGEATFPFGVRRVKGESLIKKIF